MKVVILAGGIGTRIAGESATRLKPMIEIGGRPILWPIMKIYAHHGLKDFVICLGYKGYMIREYFIEALARASQFGAYRHSGFWQPMDTLRDNAFEEPLAVWTCAMAGLELNPNLH